MDLPRTPRCAARRASVIGVLQGRNAAGAAGVSVRWFADENPLGVGTAALLEEIPGRFAGALLAGAIGVLILLYRTGCG